MQSFLRTFSRVGKLGSNSKIGHLISSEVGSVNGNLGLHNGTPLFSIFGKEAAISSRSLQSDERYSKDRLSIQNLKCCRQSSLLVENRLLSGRDLTIPHCGMFPSSYTGNHPSFRCMTTMNNPELSLQNENSASSPAVDRPPRIKFKRLDKTAKHIMNILDKEAVEKVHAEREIADIRPGCIIQLKVEVPENKRRVSILKGIVIARRNAGLNTTFRLRRLVAGVGVESVFPLYSPNIKEMKVLDRKKVRRAKLYYLRDRMNPLKK